MKKNSDLFVPDEKSFSDCKVPVLRTSRVEAMCTYPAESTADWFLLLVHVQYQLGWATAIVLRAYINACYNLLYI